MPRQATLADVAAAADVSIATASRVLNGDGRQVSEKLRTRIHAAAERLDYVPNAHAQALMRVDTRSVGVLAFDVGNPFFTEIIEGIMGVAAGADRLVTIGNVSRDPATEIRYVDLLRSQRVGAVILTGSGRVDPDPVTRLQTRLDAFRATGGRVALIGRHEVEGNRVVPDNHGGAAAAARALLEFGHTQLGVIAGPADMTVTVDRLAGFLGQCAAAGHPVAPERVVPGLFTREGGAAAMRALLDVAPPITAVFCLSDAMALGASGVLRERGVEVPRRMSLIGFDDISLAAELTPALSTVHVPLKEMGAAAMRMILDPGSDRPRTERFAAQLRLRETTGPAP
jgi:LacI family transcriptional regulator